jgi:tetratricopeptide (TPR) repeat protein
MHGHGDTAVVSRVRQGLVISGGDSVAQGWALACLIVAVCIFVLLVYLPALSAQAMLFDDIEYVKSNPLVQNPSWESVRRFLDEVWRPSTVRGYYQPLTMVSLMVDRYLAGGPDDLSAYHRTSLLLHVGNTALLGVLIYLLFGEPVVAAGVALLFGVHPITVDSVCWLSERKTLLASFFALISLILYVRFAQRRRTEFYFGCLFAYVLALLSKPITVPLPAMMLLMDYWPLDRFGRRSVVEKLPLFAVGGVFAVITYVSQGNAGGVHWPAGGNLLYVPLVLCHNVIFYLRKLILPLNLSPHYEPPTVIGFANPAFPASMIACVLMVLFLVLLFRHAPGPLIGSLIFFVMLLPAMGLIKVTKPLVANRYVYLPSIGILLVLAWLLIQLHHVLQKRWLRASYLGAPLVILVLAALGAVGTRHYLHPWTNTGEFHEYMLRLFLDAPMVHNDLGLYLASNGRYQEAVEHFRAAVRTGPDLWQAHHNLALGLDQTGGDTEEMVQHYRRAIELVPGDMAARVSLGLALCHRDDFDGGLAVLREAAEVGQRLRLPLARYALGYLLVLQGETRAGLACLRETVSVSPRFLLATEGLAWFLATHPAEAFRDPREAVLLAERARSITRGQDVAVLDILAAAYASQGQYDKAVDIAKEAVGLSTRLGDSDSTRQIEKRLRLYEAHRPYRSDPHAQLEEFMSGPQHMFDYPQVRLESLLQKGMAATLGQ